MKLQELINSSIKLSQENGTGICSLDDNPFLSKYLQNALGRIDFNSDQVVSMDIFDDVVEYLIFHPIVSQALLEIVDDVNILKHKELFDKISNLIATYINSSSMRDLLRSTAKYVYTFSKQNNHTISDLQSFIGAKRIKILTQISLKEASDVVESFSEISNFLIKQDFITPELKITFEKKGRKNNSLEHLILFELKNVLKNYSGSYMKDMILILNKV